MHSMCVFGSNGTYLPHRCWTASFGMRNSLKWRNNCDFFTNRKNKWNKIESKSSEKSQADCVLCYSVHAFGLKKKQRPHNKKNGHIKLCGYCCRNDQCRHYFVSFSINCLRLIQTDERRMPSFFKSRTIKLMRMNLNLVFIIFDDIVFNSAHKELLSIDPFESHVFLVQLWMESIV